MSQAHVTVDEEIPLNTIPGSGHATDTQNNDINISVRSVGGQPVASCCKDKHHRKLAISSILCGIVCVGIVALINSVKAEEATNPEIAKKYSRRARKFGIISITVWVSILVFTPVLLVLISYLLTLRE